ncbi:MAG: peptidase M14, partial [Proteobacteria bacterium]
MTHLTSKALFALMFAFPSLSSFASTRSQLQTKAEQTDFVETGRYDEVEKLCGDFQKHYPNKVRCFEYGKTSENRPMLAMAIGGQRSQLLPSRSDRTVVAFQGGIHAGEIDGKDAGFWFIRDVLERKVLPDVLNKVTLLFIPVFNVDGHERFAAYSRPNQSGPIESGWRVTAQNYNLNRDYLKIDAPEMKAMIALLNEWNPILYADLHVTDGAKFQQDIAVMIEPSNAGPAKLRDVAAKLSERTMKNLT